MERIAVFLSAVVSGLSMPGYVFSAPEFKRQSGSDMERMRGDWVRVGNTMRAVIDRESHAAANKKNQNLGRTSH
ncbi:MAG: hypothetical protein Q4F13_02635 [Pseudomonadota bacterium]|nr:hypothetical protein [Pseudomonadota bacterium]